MDLIKERNKQRVSKITDLRREIRDRENSLGEMPVFNDAEDSSQVSRPRALQLGI